MKRAGILALTAVCLCAPALAQGTNPYLQQAQENFEALDYERCLLRLEQAMRHESSPQERVRIELYSGLCHFYLGHEATAGEHFQMAQRLDPEVRLPSDVSPKVQSFFAASAQKLEPPTQTPADAPVVAPQEAPVTAPQIVAQPTVTPGESLVVIPEAPARRSLVAPVALGGAATVALGVGVGFGLHARSLERQAFAAHYRSDAVELARGAEHYARLTNASYAVAGATAVSAVVVYLLTRE